ncbi:MAG: hypothetical protein HY820_31570 [Acidobacteria bacterium]|nr:hypothetical protein [Acidobacteriota bacterium]
MADAIGVVAEGAAAACVPHRFGPYRVREVGRGGMGIVYEAEREGGFQQRVAVKIAPQWREFRATLPAHS